MSGNLAKIRKPVHNKCFGIEIECYAYNDSDIVRIRNSENSYKGFWKIDADGSIDVPTYKHSTVEFVSQPLPYKWLLKEIGKLPKKYGGWSVNGSCGIHVHVSKKAVSARRIRELREGLWCLSQDELVKLFRRGANSYNNHKLLSTGQRYGAVNETNEHTYEFRMSAGIWYVGLPLFGLTFYCVHKVMDFPDLYRD